jgi:hypothetical protein
MAYLGRRQENRRHQSKPKRTLITLAGTYGPGDGAWVRLPGAAPARTNRQAVRGPDPGNRIPGRGEQPGPSDL